MSSASRSAVSVNSINRCWICGSRLRNSATTNESAVVSSGSLMLATCIFACCSVCSINVSVSSLTLDARAVTRLLCCCSSSETGSTCPMR